MLVKGVGTSHFPSTHHPLRVQNGGRQADLPEQAGAVSEPPSTSEVWGDLSPHQVGTAHWGLSHLQGAHLDRERPCCLRPTESGRVTGEGPQTPFHIQQ